MRETRVLCETVLVNSDNKILILKRSDSDEKRPGQWDVPGGHMDPGELVLGAAARELQEETGIRVEPRRLRMLYALTARRGDINVVWLFFTGNSESDQPVALSDEHSDYRWVSLAEAISLIDYDLQKEALSYIRDNDLLELN